MWPWSMRCYRFWAMHVQRGWCGGVFVRETLELYSALCEWMVDISSARSRPLTYSGYVALVVACLIVLSVCLFACLSRFLLPMTDATVDYTAESCGRGGGIRCCDDGMQRLYTAYHLITLSQVNECLSFVASACVINKFICWSFVC